MDNIRIIILPIHKAEGKKKIKEKKNTFNQIIKSPFCESSYSRQPETGNCLAQENCTCLLVQQYLQVYPSHLHPS